MATGLAATVVAAEALPSCRVADVLTAQRGYADWNRTILDTTFRLASSYAPRDLRSTAAAGLNGGHSVRSLVIARSQGHGLRRAEGRCAARRPVRVPELLHPELDVLLLDPRLGLRRGAEVERPGRSQRAPARDDVDFRSYGGSAPWYYADWGRSKAGAWLRSNAWKYGFVMSYPKGKTTLTCYAYEPWHYRYVGRTMAAKVRASGLTLREYLWRLQNAPKPTPTPTPTATPSVPPSSEPSAPPSDADTDPDPDPGGGASAASRGPGRDPGTDAAGDPGRDAGRHARADARRDTGPDPADTDPDTCGPVTGRLDLGRSQDPLRGAWRQWIRMTTAPETAA